ncbi:MAG: hypothetical protein JRN20_06240 [Nitrososphaerota archaeon]|nr:hypothetical protein [Nitrososphaerota archaeon]
MISPLRSVAVAQPSKPNLSSITYVDYGGSDASGVADLQANKIDLYDFALTPSAAQSVGSSFNQYTAPASTYGLYVNPQNTSASGAYNPFYFQQVRFALNYLIDRSYFGQTIEGGNFVPCISAVCAEPDSVTVAGAMAGFSNVTYNFQFANQTIFNTLIAQKGVTYTNHQYSYNGKPIVLQLFERTDDPIRLAFMQYLNTQLQNVGFQTKLTPGTLSDAYTVVFGSDPVNGTFDIYPASNGQIWGYYDSNAINFYSCYYEDLPASDSYGPNWIGNWDNTTEQALTVQYLNQADKAAIPLLNSNFSTIAQRASLLSNLSYYGVLSSVYIMLGTSLAPYAASSAVTGVTPNFLQDPFSNYQNIMTMQVSASGSSGTAGALKMGVRHITNGAVNPIGGDDDSYSDNMQQAGALPLYGYGPSTGYPYSTGMSYVIKGNSFAGNISVPTSAIMFDGASNQWVHVASGTTAQDDVVVDVGNLLSHTTWGDGQPVTLADLLYQYVMAASVISKGNPVYDSGGAEKGIYSTEISQVAGISVINSTAVEIYTTNTFFPDANIAAIGAITDVLSPTGYAGYTNGLGMTPWQMYYAMSQVVINKQAAWSTATATADKLPWLSLLNPTDVANVKAALSAAGSTIPPAITQLQSLTGQNWVTSSTASTGYQAAINFINTNGVAVISDGPFYISQYSASTSPAFLVMKPNTGFNAGGIANPNLFAQSVVLTATSTPPAVITPGSTFTVTVLQTPNGAKSSTSTPASGANVIVQLVANGQVKSSQNLTTSSSGTVTVQIPSTLAPGTYLVNIYSQSSTSKLVNPVVQSITVTSATGGSSTTSSSSNTSSSTTSPSSNYALIAGVVVVVIIIVGLGLYMMRRGKSPAAPT